jgi:Zn-finger nucleic acid-binding protein
MTACPVCLTSQLQPAMLAQDLVAYSCPTCDGVLLSLVAYRHWREANAARAAAATEHRSGEADVAEDTAAVVNCPRCRSVMVKYRIGAQMDNRLDYCAHCEDVWLDHGEWELVEALASRGDLAKIFTRSWQRRVREDIADDMETERLKDLLGSEYATVESFRNWLQEHRARDEIIALLRRRKR